MSNYYDKADGKVAIARALMARGWKVYNFHEDESDSMSDYYSPARWFGVATKNGYTLVMDQRNDTKEYQVKQYNKDGNLSFEDREKISKLEEMRVDRGCTIDEAATAQKLIEIILGKTNGIDKYIIVDTIPAYMANPGKCKWHIEKDGRIYDKGTGITKYADIPRSYEFDIVKMEYNDSYKYYTEYDCNIGDYKRVERTLKDNELKVINDFKALILRFERIVNNMNGCGDGTEETAKQAAEQATNEVMEKVIEKITKKSIKPVLKTDNTININDVLSFSYHGHYWIVTNIYKNSKDIDCVVYECLGSEKRGYQRVKNPKSFYQTMPNLLKEIEAGKTKIYTLQEVEEITEVEKWVKKTENKQPKIKTEETKETAQEQPQNTPEYDIKQDIDTRDNSTIFVVKVIRTLSKDEYIKVNNYMNTIKGYYSKFKHGFIFKYDPTNILENGDSKTYSQDTNDPYKLSEIEDDYIYNCHFKSWNLDIEEIKIMINNLQIPYIDMGDKIGFEGLTAEDTKKVKEISDKNSSIFFIDSKEKIKTEDDIIKQQETAQTKRQKLIEKIDKQIESAQDKIKSVSGDYKTNTWKRQNEQASRESKKEGFQLDIDILEWVKNQLYERDLTQFEECLTISAFRDAIHSYCMRHNAYNKENRATALKEIEFPSYIQPIDSWWNKEVPKKQKQLEKAGITNTRELIKAAEYYGEIYKQASKPIDRTAQKIKKLESEYRLNQKGDINFTPSAIAKQLVEYANLNSTSRVLEPSCGIGNIADVIRQTTNNIDVVEQMSGFRELLQLKGYNLVGYDFLEYTTDNLYDAIIMNPPFSDEVNHIKHAYSLLKNGGTLVSITSPHWTFANDKQSTAFRSWIDNENSYTIDLSSGTFEMTGVSSKILVIEKAEETETKTA
jgi:hypothetical protein